MVQKKNGSYPQNNAMFSRYTVSRSRVNIMPHIPGSEGFSILPKELPGN